VAVHCASLSSTLLESELFGHEAGAFTGATARHIGRFEIAHGGTLFLDEIGEIDGHTQVKLLRFLETKVLERVGSSKPISVDVRVISATNKNLRQMVSQGTFREDLYYRLNVIELKVPPLRDRGEDIPLLFQHYIDHFCHENGRGKSLSVTPQVIAKLTQYTWPGNIRELRNTCESIVALLPKDQNEITLQDLGEKFS
ncbi:MAG: sigma 54-interacting transcriptional regulator, partial [Puniceicoccales bacterium]|nr:sigma 54-interacting transcriptional regulator [Puniceicoccales bacterium]